MACSKARARRSSRASSRRVADELQTDGQAIAREPAGQGDGAQVEEVDGDGVAQAEAIDGEIDLVAVNLVENWGGKRGGWGNEESRRFRGPCRLCGAARRVF